MSQQGDVLLYQTNDGGEINVVNGLIEMSGGLETAVYVSLFGGNEYDDGRDKNPFTFWGNLDEIDPALKYISETQFLLKELPATTGNLNRLEQAAKRDTKWLLDKKVASFINITVTIPAINSIKISIEIEAQGLLFNFDFVENWKVLK